MGNATYYQDGGWNVTCDLCGKKVKASETEKTWDNFYVCRSHKEERNPQDYLRGIRDVQTVAFSRPTPPLNFVTSSYILQQQNGFGLLQEADAFGNTFYLLVT